jgi:hypothetical protein
MQLVQITLYKILHVQDYPHDNIRGIYPLLAFYFSLQIRRESKTRARFITGFTRRPRTSGLV